jgi:drug/metabolite transporter (DMT)-like permease
MTDDAPRIAPKTLAAFGAVYLIWGSTFAAIRISLESFPPLLMGAFRFGVAGCLLYAILRLAGHGRPSARQWGAAAVVGTLMFLGGSGMVGWAQQSVDSGLTSALVATVPLWVVLLDWLLFGGPRPGKGPILGLALGLGGVCLLVSPQGGLSSLDGRALVVVGAGGCWALGSLLSRRMGLPSSAFMTAAMQMIAGGVALTALGASQGELSLLQVPTRRACLALTYLVVPGCLVALSSYVYLLRTVRPAAAATYAFVNPVIALTIGHFCLGETLDTRMGVGAALVVAAVILIVGGRLLRRRPPLRLVQPPAPTSLHNKTRSAA